jgi:hypothetical protein
LQKDTSLITRLTIGKEDSGEKREANERYSQSIPEEGRISGGFGGKAAMRLIKP